MASDSSDDMEMVSGEAWEKAQEGRAPSSPSGRGQDLGAPPIKTEDSDLDEEKLDQLAALEHGLDTLGLEGFYGPGYLRLILRRGQPDQYITFALAAQGLGLTEEALDAEFRVATSEWPDKKGVPGPAYVYARRYLRDRFLNAQEESQARGGSGPEVQDPEQAEAPNDATPAPTPSEPARDPDPTQEKSVRLQEPPREPDQTSKKPARSSTPAPPAQNRKNRSGPRDHVKCQCAYCLGKASEDPDPTDAQRAAMEEAMDEVGLPLDFFTDAEFARLARAADVNLPCVQARLMIGIEANRLEMDMSDVDPALVDEIVHRVKNQYTMQGSRQIIRNSVRNTNWKFMIARFVAPKRKKVKGRPWKTLNLSVEQAYQESDATGRFVERYPAGFQSLPTSGYANWCMFFAIHRALVIEFGERAPTLVQLFRSYVQLGQNAEIWQDMGARHNFRIDQAAAFVNEVTRRLLNETVQIGMIRPDGPEGQPRATLYDNGEEAEGQGPNRVIWILYSEGVAGHYEPVVGPNFGDDRDQRRAFQRQVAGQDRQTVDAILYLDQQLRNRNMTMTDLDDDEAERWMMLLRSTPREEWDVYVESMVGEPNLDNVLAMQIQEEALNGEDDMWNAAPSSNPVAEKTPPMGSPASEPEASAVPANQEEEVVGDDPGGKATGTSQSGEIIEEEGAPAPNPNPNAPDGDDDPPSDGDGSPGPGPEDDSDGSEDGDPNAGIQGGIVRPAGGHTDQRVEIWMGPNPRRPDYLPQLLGHRRYTIVDTRDGQRAVPTSILAIPETGRAYLPTCVRDYLRSLSRAQMPSDVPPPVRDRLDSLLNTYNWAMKPSCQPLSRRWDKTRHALLSIALVAATNRRGRQFDRVAEFLRVQGAEDLLDPNLSLGFDEELRLVNAQSGRVICEAGRWATESRETLIDRRHRASDRQLPEGEDRFRERQEDYRRRSDQDPRLTYQRTGWRDAGDRPVIRVVGELFAEDNEADARDLEQIPLNVFARDEHQKKFARSVGCSMPHEPGSRTVSRTPPLMAIGDEGIDQPGRLQVVNDVRLLVHRVLQYYTERTGTPLDSANLVGEITREIRDLQDHVPVADPENAGRVLDRGFLYYFVGNRNRKRLYEFLRDRIGDHIAQTRGEGIPWAILQSIERDLNLLGPQLLHLIVDENGVLSAARKFGQGASEGSHYTDTYSFLRDNPDPIVVEPRGQKTPSTWKERSLKRKAGANVSPRRPGQKDYSKKAPRRARQKGGRAGAIERAMETILQGMRRPGEDLMTAAQRFAEDMSHRQQQGRDEENPVDLTGDEPKEEPDQEGPLIDLDEDNENPGPEDGEDGGDGVF